jgi:hypothetical protein
MMNGNGGRRGRSNMNNSWMTINHILNSCMNNAIKGLTFVRNFSLEFIMRLNMKIWLILPLLNNYIFNVSLREKMLLNGRQYCTSCL